MSPLLSDPMSIEYFASAKSGKVNDAIPGFRHAKFLDASQPCTN